MSDDLRQNKFPLVSPSELAPARKEGYPAIELGNESLTKRTGICPDCGRTAIKQRRAVDSWFCTRCDKAFREDQLIKE